MKIYTIYSKTQYKILFNGILHTMVEKRHTSVVHIVIFGATGDLSRKKLLSSLFNLWRERYVSKNIMITAFSRREWTDEDYRSFAFEFLESKNTHTSTHEEKIKFLKQIHYHYGNFDNRESFVSLYKKLSQDASDLVLYYLATPPSTYDDIFKNIQAVGLHTVPKKQTRICIEKPFGSDLKTARKLGKNLASMFREEAIFRIDHYLAKDALQNVLTFRFTNRLFEDIWNKDGIEKVALRFFEKGGVENRAEFYDSVGALRDVGQNHILQMLAMVAMKNPIELTAERVRTEREKILSRLKIYTKNDIKKYAVRGQYIGYQKLPTIKKNSKTETYFQVKTFLDDDNWRGVPFYMEGGKNFSEHKVEIEITFRPIDPCVCGVPDHEKHKNTLLIKLAPDAGIDIVFWAKKPGVVFSIEKRKLSFRFDDLEGREKLPEAYETVLYEAIKGDPLLFTTSKEVESTWKFISPIVKHWNEVPLKKYKPETKFPKEIV